MEVAIFIAHFKEAAEAAYACVVDKNINFALNVLRAFYRRRDRSKISDVRMNCRTTVTASNKLIRQFFNLIGDIQQDQVRTVAGKCSGDPFANTLRCARNQCCFAREFSHFNILLLNMKHPLHSRRRYSINKSVLRNGSLNQVNFR
ncbi:hypothetical protein D3C73_1024940 [compost metagenome]